MKLIIDTENKTVIIEELEVNIGELRGMLVYLLGPCWTTYKLLPKVNTVYVKEQPCSIPASQPLPWISPPWTAGDPPYNPYTVSCTAKNYPPGTSISNTKSNE